MSAAPIRPNPLEKKVAELARKVAELERKARVGGATTLDGLRDTEVLYDHWTDLPKLDQALRWDTTRESKFHGLASFADPTVVADYFTVPITGDGTFGVDEFLVGSDWDITRPCRASATIVFNGAYTPQQSQAAVGDVPTLNHAGPIMAARLVDRGTGYVTTPGAGFEVADEVWPVVAVTGNSPSPTAVLSPTRTLSWDFLRGRPKIQASCTVSIDAEPGLSGSPEIVVLTRCTRL